MPDNLNPIVRKIVVKNSSIYVSIKIRPDTPRNELIEILRTCKWRICRSRTVCMYHDFILFNLLIQPLCEITTNNKALSLLQGISRESIRIDRHSSSALHTQPLFHRLFFVKRTPLYWTCASKVALDLFHLFPSLFPSSSLDLSYAFGP